MAIPEAKQTTLGLYVTAAEAYDMYQASPDTVRILDVRTPEEYVFVGHPEMAINIPLAFATYHHNEEEEHFDAKVNEEFIGEVQSWADPSDVLLVMCRSGGRSAMAINALAQVGYTNAYNILDGMEGDLVDDEASLYFGKRMKNGWKNSGLPWTYKYSLDKMRLPKDE